MKILEHVTDAHLQSIITISPNQCWFVKGHGMMDVIHAARLLTERHKEKRRTVHIAFLNLEKAFDQVLHKFIWYSLCSHGIPEVYVHWVQLPCNNATSSIHCTTGVTELFHIWVDVHQGSALLPLLRTVDLQTSHLGTLLYADDVMLACETQDGIE